MIERPRHPGLVAAETHLGPRMIRIVVVAGFALLGLVGFAAARTQPRPILRTPRPEPVIRQMLAEGAHAGDCSQCHTTHGDDQPTVYPNALVGPDDNALCERCHDTAWIGGSWADDPLYRGTGHGSSTHMVWPGPEPGMRLEIDAATKCLNCHDPHGWSDAQGEIPMLAIRREEQLCLACHDGSPANGDIASDLRKPFRHPTTDVSGRHDGPTESLPSDFGVTPTNRRHAECEDCHNPHVSRADAGSLEGSSDASKTTLGVSRVLVQNGVAGQRPLYTFVAGSDTLTSPVAEYQLCFKCHSSWTTQPAGQADLATELNPANASFHPVEEAGRNPNISSFAFAPGWSANSITRCGSCHGADFGNNAGPHGSSNEHLLRAPSPASSSSRLMGSDELCFSCHAYDVYANPASTPETRAASRWNAPAVSYGHAEHVGTGQVPCWACHVTHGSPTQPFLMVTGRNPGMIAYSASATGGTCTSTCHGVESYTLNYAH